jgi:hypothetical protein
MTDTGGWNPMPNTTARTTPAQTPRTRGETLWQATHNGKVMTCELRDDSSRGAG